MADLKSEEISWQAEDISFINKTVSWYWLSFTVAALLFIFALWRGNFLFAVFIIIAESLLIFTSLNPSPPRYVTLNSKGIYVNGNFHPWKKWDSFSIDFVDEVEEIGEIRFHNSSHFGLDLHFLLIGVEVDKVKKMVNNYLTEVQYEPSLIDTLSRFL